MSTNDISSSIRKLSERARLLAADPGLKFVLREAEFQGDGVANSILLRKLLLYAPTTVLITKEARYVTPVGDHRPNASVNWASIPKSLLLTSDELAALERDASEFCLHMPERVIEEQETWDNDEFYRDGESVVFSIDSHWDFGNALTVHLNDPFIRQQLTESSLSVINTRLPVLKNIPTADFLLLRKDEAESFSAMHHVLQTLAMRLPQADSNNKIKLLLQEVDQNVRRIERRFQEITRKHRASLAEVVVGVSVIGICMSIPSDFAKALSAFVGSYQVKEFVRNLFRKKEELSALELSEFYAAWKVHSLRRNSSEKK